MFPSLTKIYGKRGLKLLMVILSLSVSPHIPIQAAQERLSDHTHNKILATKPFIKALISGYGIDANLTQNLPLVLQEIIFKYLYIGQSYLSLIFSNEIDTNGAFTPFRVIGGHTIISYGPMRDSKGQGRSMIEILAHNLKTKEAILYSLQTQEEFMKDRHQYSRISSIITTVKAFRYKDKHHLFLGYESSLLKMHTCEHAEDAATAYGDTKGFIDINFTKKGRIHNIYHNGSGKVVVSTSLGLIGFSMEDIFKEKFPYFYNKIAYFGYEVYKEGLINDQKLACMVRNQITNKYDLLLYDIDNGKFCNKLENPFESFAIIPSFFFGKNQIIRYTHSTIKVYEIPEQKELNNKPFSLYETPKQVSGSLVPLHNKIYIVPMKNQGDYYELIDLSEGTASQGERLALVKNNKKKELLEGLSIASHCNTKVYCLGMYVVIKNLYSVHLLEFVSQVFQMSAS